MKAQTKGGKDVLVEYRCPGIIIGQARVDRGLVPSRFDII
jgi:hypothetical protein